MVAKLSGWFIATDWSVFYQDNDDRQYSWGHRRYIDFCVDTVTTKRTIKLYPNNKDYITPEIKQCLRRKQPGVTMLLNLNPRQRSYGWCWGMHGNNTVCASGRPSPTRTVNSSGIQWKTFWTLRRGKHCMFQMRWRQQMSWMIFYLRFDCDANRVLEECNSVLSSVTCDELS